MNLDLHLFVSVFTLVFIAELPDKTALATLVLASRNSPTAVFIGAALAFVIQSLVAVAFGRLFVYLPPQYVRYASAILFFIFAVKMWREKMETSDESETPPHSSFFRALWTAFLMIFIAEWGDLTQLATATLQAKTQATMTVLIASVLALWSVAGLYAASGHMMRRRIHPERLQKIAAIMFFTVGIYFLIS